MPTVTEVQACLDQAAERVREDLRNLRAALPKQAGMVAVHTRQQIDVLTGQQRAYRQMRRWLSTEQENDG